MHRSKHHLLPAVIPLLAVGCYRAPELSGNDQVYDPNVEATRQKDSGLAALAWEPVDTFMNGLVGSPDNPGCAVGVARDGSLTYLQGYGKAELGGEDWGVGTMGAVGSVSKTFTAAAALRMHDLGMIDVNDTVDDYLATTNGALGNARIYDLLSHASGVGGATQAAAFAPNWTPGSNAATCVNNNSAACLMVSQSIQQPSIAFLQYDDNEAVAAFADGQGVYSNVGYSVLGAVIDSQSAYEAFVWNEIGQYTGDDLDPGNLLSLALTHSWRDGDMPHRAVGYQWSGGAWVEREAFDASGLAGLEGWEGPAGGWAMTIGDLTRFALALNQGDILSNNMLLAMRMNWTDLDGFADDYGFGVFLGASGPPYWHGGTIGGHNAVWSYWPASGSQPSLAMAIMCNRNISPFSLRDHTTTLRGRIAGSSPVQPATIAVPRVGTRAGGRTLILEDRGAWQAAPADTFVSLDALVAPLELSTRLDRGALTIVIAQGGKHLATVPATWSDPWFTTRPTTMALRTTVGSVPVRGFSIRGAITEKGLTGGSIAGTLDAREVSGSVGIPASELCTTRRGTSRCQPCADGARYCVSMRYEGLTGRDH
ncbi:MAG: beta-lactamase family protein [Kofleriaceae bacterium]|nr:MAG: beta-lactamase family protein [Kofleriaceae bacterium]